MLRQLREQWWYMLLWLPLCTALIFLALWLLIVFRIIGIWTIQYDAAPKWGFLSIGVFALFLFVLVVLFPRKPARGLPFRHPEQATLVVAPSNGSLTISFLVQKGACPLSYPSCKKPK